MVAGACAGGGYSPHDSLEAERQKEEEARDKIYPPKAYPQ
jgi:hypothetical protein